MESNKQEIILKIYEDDVVEIWMQNDILFCTYKKGAIIDLEGATKFNLIRNDLCKGIKKRHYADCREVKYWTHEARKYNNSEEATKCISAVAIIVKSDIQKIIWNWAAKFLNISTPARLFSIKEKEAALQWLEKYK